jgi:hypothetical protein
MPVQVFQGDGDPGWQRQLCDLRDGSVDRIRDLAECHLTVLPHGVRCVRSTFLGLPQAAGIHHGPRTESLDERQMRVADEEDVGLNQRAWLTLARRMRGSHSCAQTSSWSTPLSLP